MSHTYAQEIAANLERAEQERLAGLTAEAAAGKSKGRKKRAVSRE